MNMGDAIRELLSDFGTWCQVKMPADVEPRPVFMVVQSTSTGSIHSRYTALSFVDKNTLPRGADWGYGLLLAEDAPHDMQPETRLQVTDSLGAVWDTEAAKAVRDVNTETHLHCVVAWRLALRGKQRMARGK